jgi:Tfp pilus assembly protein PilF
MFTTCRTAPCDPRPPRQAIGRGQAFGRSALLALAAGLMVGCATLPPAAAPAAGPEPLWADALFAAPTGDEPNRDPLALSAAMRAYLEAAIVPAARSKGAQRALLDTLYHSRQLKLHYDAAVTRDAGGAFEARSGNCLSLVLMTSAFARELGIEVQYQAVTDLPTWSRADDLVLANRHVNIGLGQRLSDPPTAWMAGRWLVVDFLPSDDAKRLRTTVIAEHTIVAMYRNNRAVEALAQGRVDEAYWWARTALERAPTFLTAANTLGVVYRRAGHSALAERALRHVLGQEPDNVQALGNLEQLLRQQGRGAEAVVFAERLRSIEPLPPFHHFDLGLAALQDGRPSEARRLFGLELQRAAHHHETHFWLAIAHLKLGELQPARRHLRLALDNSPTADTRTLYAGKLERLEAEAAGRRRALQ